MVAIKVELAPTNGAQDASPTWVDISQYVSLSAGITCNRGRGRTATTPEPGRLTLTLNNDDGRFTWGNPDGAYGLGLGENAQLRQPIRVTALVGEYDSDVIAYDAAFDYDGYTEVPLWTGYVDEWVGTWDNGYRPRVRVTASDRLARLALLNLDDGAIRSEILYDQPIAYYPLNEESGKVSAGNQAGQGGWPALQQQDVGAGSGSIDFGAGETPDGVGTAVAFTQTSNSNGKSLTGRTDAVGSLPNWTMEVWVRAASWSVDQIFVGLGFEAGGHYGSIGYYPSTGLIGFQADPSNFILATQTPATNEWVHLAWTNDGSFLRAYYQGAPVGSVTAVTGVAQLPIETLTIGSIGPATQVAAAAQYLFDGQVANFALYFYALDADRIAQHYAAGKSAGSFYGEAASARFTRLCRLSGLPAAAYATDATATTLVGAQNLGGVGMLDAIQQVTDSERGVVIVNGSGVLTYLSAQSIANLTADVTLAATDINGDVGLTTNDLELTNDVTVVRAGGATQRRADDTSIAQIGSNAVTVETLLTTDEEAGALADLLLSQGLVIQPRTDDLTLDLAAKFRTIPVAAVCGLDTGSRVTVTGLPTGSPSSTIDVLVQGVAHSIGASKWDLTLTVTPALTLPAWELDDATLSVLGSTTRLGYP